MSTSATLPDGEKRVICIRGLRTTTAVVQSIFLVIVLDAVFAVFFSSIGWR